MPTDLQGWLHSRQLAAEQEAGTGQRVEWNSGRAAAFAEAISMLGRVPGD